VGKVVKDQQQFVGRLGSCHPLKSV